ncbi:MAG: CDP-diacylglycerol--glycerol-3-phosphate 3-phosphatidyltransferase [Solirubrobacterales bacterium]
MLAFNLPNLLTVLRILAVPVIVVALLDRTPNGDTVAAVVFALAAATDTLDGYIARSRNSITTLGKLLDPLADKLLVTAALIALVSLERLDAWVAMVIIAREFAVTGLRTVAAQQGLVIAASGWGKAKTLLQVVMLFSLILVSAPIPAWVTVLVYVTVLVTVLSGADYFFGLRRRIDDNREEIRARRSGKSSSRRPAAETPPATR